MSDRLNRRLRQLERAVRPKSVAAIRQAGEVARAVDALEAATAALQAAATELHALGATLREAQTGETPPSPPGNDVYDRQTELVMRKVVRAGDICIDVGANEGVILERIVSLAPAARHHAFEPIPALAAGLRERFPEVEVHEVALSDREGTSSFHHVTSNPSYSGLRERRYDRPGETVDLITVRTARLDDVLPPDVDVRLVKIDVEGGEEGVLRGGLGMLARCQPYVVFEHGLGAADHYGTTPEVVFDLLCEVGLEVTLLERYLAGHPSLSRDEFVAEFTTGRNYYFLAHPPGG